MMFWMIGAGLGVLALLFRLAALTRLTIPLLYTVSMLTVFHGWYQTHTALADNILFVLVGLVVLSWLLSLLGRVWSFIQEKRNRSARTPSPAPIIQNIICHDLLIKFGRW